MVLSISDGGYVHGAEYGNLFEGMQQRGTKTGCQVVEQSPQSMGVDVQTGTLLYDGADVSVSSQSLTIAASDTEDRFDLVTLDSAGTADVVQGSPAPDSNTPPTAPDLPSGEVVLAVVTVPANATEITQSNIRDSRIFIDIAPDPGGSDNQLQFNDGGSFAGISELTWDGTELALNAPLSLGASSRRFTEQVEVENASPFTVSLNAATTDPSFTGGATLAFRKAAGGFGSETFLESGETLGRLAWLGWQDHASGYTLGSEMVVLADGAWNDGTGQDDAQWDLRMLRNGSMTQMISITDRYRFQDETGGLLLGVDPHSALATDETALFVASNRGGTDVVTRVELGSENSGDSGFRVLQIPNQ